MRRTFVTAALATLIVMAAARSGFAQAYPVNPYAYNPGNAGIMGVGPGGRAAYRPQYYSGAGYYGGSFYGGYDWGMYNGYGYGPANVSPNVTGLPSEPEAAPDETYLQRYYSPGSSTAIAGAAAHANPNTAAIDVRVPAGTQLSFQGEQTQQNGAIRFFASPPLEPGRTYAYKIKAMWKDAKGEKIERARTVQVHAGDYVRLDLRRE